MSPSNQPEPPAGMRANRGCALVRVRTTAALKPDPQAWVSAWSACARGYWHWAVRSPSRRRRWRDGGGCRPQRFALIVVLKVKLVLRMPRAGIFPIGSGPFAIAQSRRRIRIVRTDGESTAADAVGEATGRSISSNASNRCVCFSGTERAYAQSAPGEVQVLRPSKVSAPPSSAESAAMHSKRPALREGRALQPREARASSTCIPPHRRQAPVQARASDVDKVPAASLRRCHANERTGC